MIGISNDQGPFKWIGMPAYRIPVGGTYAHPAAGVLQEWIGDGTRTDLQYNHWDKFRAFEQQADKDAAFDGFLRYQWRMEEARIVNAAADTALGQNQGDAAVAETEIQSSVSSLTLRGP